MRHPKDSLFIRRLNAPTRVAAARRRRLRKGTAAVLTALAVLVALAPGSGRDGSSMQAGDASNVRGRHILGLPADPGLAAALTSASRVNVWDGHGNPLVRNAPVVIAEGKRAGIGTSVQDQSTVLVAIESKDIPRISRQRTTANGDAPNITLTICP